MKNTSWKHFLLAGLGLLAAGAVKAQEPVLPIPEPKQVEWQKMETYAFVHFGLNTFNDREWGYGDSDPNTFNPTRLNCEQWVRTFKEAGLTGVILTAKHHDGFCLWPTQLTEYCIRNTPYKDGKGDVVGDLCEACKKYGIKFAVYLSPWDRNHADYGTPAYVDYYHKQLRELMTNYGEVFEVWFDGANGGDGYYGGAKESRTIDRRNYYNYPKIYEILDELQPNAVIFGDGGPGCRWVGNEGGYASPTNWSFLRKGEVYPGYPNYRELQYGHADGNQWVPAECDVSIRPGWFYHPEEDDKVKTPEQLADLYYRNVGHNGTFLLNFPVNREGLISKTDSINAVKFHQIIQKELGVDLLKSLKAKVSNSRKGHDAMALTDGDYDTYWATEDGVTKASIEYRFPNPVKINRMMLQEYIPLGQRVKSFTVEYEDKKGDWKLVQLNEETTTIGYKRLLRFPTVEARKLRVTINDARGPIVLNRVAAFWGGEGSDDIFQVKNTNYNSSTYTMVGVSEEESKKAVDKNEATTCYVSGDHILIDLGSAKPVTSVYYLPDQSEQNNGIIANYELYGGVDENSLKTLLAKGEFSNIEHNPIRQEIHFAPQTARFLLLKSTKTLHAANGKLGVAELGVVEP